MNEALNRAFLAHYAPYQLPDYRYQPRSISDLPALADADAETAALFAETDAVLAENPLAGITPAANALLRCAQDWLRRENRPDTSILALLGAVGGRECERGILTAAFALDPDINSAELDILIADGGNDAYFLFGDRLESELSRFYLAATNGGGDPKRDFVRISAECSPLIGKPEYWQTHFDAQIGANPQALADGFEGEAEEIFAIYTPYPQTRAMAVSGAAQLALNLLKKPDTPLHLLEQFPVLAEYAWRTAHYLYI